MPRASDVDFRSEREREKGGTDARDRRLVSDGMAPERGGRFPVPGGIPYATCPSIGKTTSPSLSLSPSVSLGVPLSFGIDPTAGEAKDTIGFASPEKKKKKVGRRDTIPGS